MDQEPLVTPDASPLVTPPVETPPAAEEGSVAEHAAEFGPQRETPESAAADGEGERDAQGRFKPRPKDRRPDSHKARPEDVPRIHELTKKLREAEAERDRLKQAPPPVPATTLGPVTPLLDTATKPTPEKFDDYEAYLDARDLYNRWKWTEEARVREDNQRIISSWKSRVDAAIQAHPDFEEIALKAQTKIPVGSLMDAWILESTAGAEILYALQQDDGERQRIAVLSPVQQAEALTLLGQRLSTTRPQAVATGSASAPPLSAAPRPPNPVRTGPMRTGDTPPGEEGSILDHARFYGPSRLRGR